MKTNLLILFITLFGIQTTGFSQNEDVVANLSASEFNGKVLISWSIKQGNTCNGIQILRSSDSLNFSPVGSISGVCGSSLEDVPYEFTDVDPIKNIINYYRLNLGGIGFSRIVHAEVIDVTANNYLLRPNPISDSSELYFANNASNTILFNIYNSQGQTVHSSKTTSNKIILRKSDFESGTYFFSLIDQVKNSKIKGRFLVP